MHIGAFSGLYLGQENKRMSLLIFLGFLPAVILLVAAIHASIKRFKYYRLFYKTLPFKRFYRSNGCVYSHRAGQKDDDFIWFLDTDWFRLPKGHYLTDPWGDPVRLFWKRKFQRWFKENINLEYLPEHNPLVSYSSSLNREHEFPSSHVYDAYLRRYYARVALQALANKDALNEALVRDVMEVANKLVAELRFKEKAGRL